MFNACEFTFNGESSRMYGLMVYDIGGRGQEDVSFGNRASIIETRIPGRIQPIHFGVNYHEKPLEFKIVFGSERALDRYEMESIAFWLTGHQNYCWLTIEQPDMSMYQYYCLISELTPISHGWLPVAFEASVICDCPYAYGYPFSYDFTLSGEQDVDIYNDGSAREYIKPVIQFRPIQPMQWISGQTGTLRIVNHSDADREFSVENIPYGDSQRLVVIDGNTGIISETPSNLNLYGGFNLKFFRLVPGENRLTISGNGELNISGRYLYNVAG